MTSFLPSQQHEPVAPRRLLPSWVRWVATLATSVLFGVGLSTFDMWPAWASYLVKLAIAVPIGLIMGYIQEQPWSVAREWRGLRWRFIWQQTLSWALSLILFLSGLNAYKQPYGWQTFLIVAPVFLAVSILSNRLTSSFRCPHCLQRFFKEGLEASEPNFWAFGEDKLSNTHCQYCDWPLWKPMPKE